MELPVSFQEQMKQLLGGEYEAYVRSFKEKRVYGLRVNTAKISPQEFERICPFAIRPIPWIPNGYYYEGTEKPAKHPYYFAGLYYLQEPSAMTPAHLLPVCSGDRVLDLCAAPGGKSTELGAKLKGSGILISNDISNSRAKALLKNLELFGIPNAVVMSENPKKMVKNLEGYFDKILIDAPCSGEGMFRKEPAMIKSWLEHGNEFYAKLQRGIVKDALSMLRPGGMLLYSTCTFSPEENEKTVEYMMECCPELKIVSPERYEGFGAGLPERTGGPDELKECVRIWPQRMQGEGHFLALLQKGKEINSDRETDKNRRAAKPAKFLENYPEFLEFMEQISVSFDHSRMELRENKIRYLPETEVNLSGLRIMRSGLLMGECKKNRFEPSQALAMSMKKEDYAHSINFSADDPRVVKYLKGETLESNDREGTPKKGWQLICVDGYPLGFAKASNGVLKNKYLAGWRWQ